MAVFGPNPWVNPFGKMSIFRLFELLVFIAQKGVFSFQNIVKDIFLPCIAKKNKSWKNGNFCTKTIGKLEIFRLSELLVFIAQKDDFSFQNIVKDIFLAYTAKKKKVGKMAIFKLFELLVFIAQKGVFWFQNIVKDIFLAYIA